jgi:hypothetical protein
MLSLLPRHPHPSFGLAKAGSGVPYRRVPMGSRRLLGGRNLPWIRGWKRWPGGRLCPRSALAASPFLATFCAGWGRSCLMSLWKTQVWEFVVFRDGFSGSTVCANDGVWWLHSCTKKAHIFVVLRPHLVTPLASPSVLGAKI